MELFINAIIVGFGLYAAFILIPLILTVVLLVVTVVAAGIAKLFGREI